MPRRNSDSDAGDVAKKFMQGLGYIHRVGGVGLDLIAIGGVILFFLMLLDLDKPAVFIASIILIIVGAIILLKEKKCSELFI